MKKNIADVSDLSIGRKESEISGSEEYDEWDEYEDEEYIELYEISWKDELIKRWDNVVYVLLNDIVPLEECDDVDELISETREYFESLPVKGTMTVEDCRLYESASALRYLSYIFEPKECKEEFNRVCTQVRELFETLESISK